MKNQLPAERDLFVEFAVTHLIAIYRDRKKYPPTLDWRQPAWIALDETRRMFGKLQKMEKPQGKIRQTIFKAIARATWDSPCPTELLHCNYMEHFIQDGDSQVVEQTYLLFQIADLDRQIVMLCEQGASVADIADIINAPASDIEWRLRRSYNRLDRENFRTFVLRFLDMPAEKPVARNQGNYGRPPEFDRRQGDRYPVLPARNQHNRVAFGRSRVLYNTDTLLTSE